MCVDGMPCDVLMHVSVDKFHDPRLGDACQFYSTELYVCGCSLKNCYLRPLCSGS